MKRMVSHTIFTWLNAAATISHLLNFTVATIQGRPLIEGGVYCTEALSVQQLFDKVLLCGFLTQVWVTLLGQHIRQVRSTMHVSVF